MRKNFIVFSLFVLTILLTSCSTQKPARGPEDEILVVADSIEYQILKPALDSAFEKIIYTPQPEKIFNLKRINVNQLNHYKNRKNIIITAPLNSDSHTSKYIQTVLDSAVKQKVRADSAFNINKYDLWAKDQLIMVLTAPTMDKLISQIKFDRDNLLYAFQNISDKRLYASLYNERYELKKIEGEFLQKYGWVIYVQADYRIAKDAPEDNFVWIRRSPNSDMERWIFIHWIDNASPEYLNEDSIKVIRNRMTKKFYRTTNDSGYVIIAEDYFTTSEVNFNGRYALMTQGLWDLNIKGMGGPFVNYTFYDEKTKRIYMIDGSVFAPKYYKRNLIQQMDVTLQSFMTKSELSKDRKETLLEAANDE